LAIGREGERETGGSADLPQDTAPHRRRRCHRLRRDREVAAHAGHRIHLAAADVAGIVDQVALESRGLFGVERVERIERGQRLLLAGEGGVSHGWLPTADSASRSFVIASRIRVFTVPSGWSSLAAISVWLKPS